MEFIKEKLKRYWKWLFGLLIPVAFAAPLVLPDPGMCVNIKGAIAGKAAQERHFQKADRVAKCFETGTFDNAKYGVRIQIQSVEKITMDGKDGIEVIARAWKSDSSPMNPTGSVSPVGFGKDGSVEWERFRIFNPPIMIPDGTKRLVTKRKDAQSTETIEVDNFKEDLQGAIVLDLAHTISLIGKNESKIIPGKVGNTAYTFYPDGDPESTSVDGNACRCVDNQTWANIHDGAGNTHTDNVSTGAFYRLETGAPGGTTYSQIHKSFFLFDSSPLNDAGTADSAILSVYGSAKTNGINPTPEPDINIYTSTPASNTDIVNADYQQFGTTAQSSAITHTNISTTGYNDFTLNDMTKISKTGITKYGGRNANYDVANVAPVGAYAGSDFTIYFAEQTGSTNDPKLVVQFTDPVVPVSGDEVIGAGIIQF